MRPGMTSTVVTAALFLLIGGASAVEPLSPCGPVAEPGDGRVYLDWNPSTFDEVIGYHVYRIDGWGFEPKRLTADPIARPEYVDSTVANGSIYLYFVTGVMKDGSETPHSPAVSVSPVKVPNPKRKENVFTFADGQEIELDENTLKLISWKSPDGLQLASPTIYGAPICLTELDERGMQLAEHATEERPQMAKPISKTYKKVGGSIKVRDGRVMVSYSIPMAGFGANYGSGGSYIQTKVWETWYPVERKIGSTIYRGIARRIELDVPSYYQDGFSLNLNDGFGIDGSCKDAVTYKAYTWGSRMQIIHWDPEVDKMAFWHVRWGCPRAFHPDQMPLNVHPFMFVDHPQGTMVLTARRQNYAIHAGFTNYVKQGKDGLWPNFSVDLDNPGKRFCVDTFEYLFSPDRTLEAPQRYIDARFHYSRQIAEQYGYPTEHPNLVMEITRVHLPDIPAGQEPDLEMYRKRGESVGKEYASRGVDCLISSQEFWPTAPYVTPELMHDADHPVNKALVAWAKGLKRHGVEAGFWYRPETVKTTRGVLFSDHFPKATYYGIQSFPDIRPLLEERGIPLVRNNPQWLRKVTGGRYIDELYDRPEKPITAYSWTPMSMHSRWYDEVIYPSFEMTRKLGFTISFFDGSFGCLSGMDYADGRAVAVQPYWSRMIRTACKLGVPPVGECGIGVGPLFCFSPSGEASDGKMAWMFAGCPLMCNDGPSSEEWMHKLHQLYAVPFLINTKTPRAHAFAKEFVKKYGAPRPRYPRWPSPGK